jgi:paraquat-inducible protein B
MNETLEPQLPQPRPARPRLRLSRVWIIPFAAAAIALGLVFQHLAAEGPTITVTFKSVAGIEPGKTQIRYKDVAIGLVTGVRLTPDDHAVEVSAKISKDAEGLMTEGASFWIVRPHVTATEISGLGTLLSGNYIGFDRGVPDRVKRQFVGLENPRLVDPDTPGRHFTVRAMSGERVEAGLPVYHLGLQVGQVTSVAIASDHRALELDVFVNAPYDVEVLASTRFWTAGGIDVTVDGTGVNLRTEALLAVLVGGLAFDSPRAAPRDAAAAGTSFALYRDRPTAMKQPDPGELRYVLHFDEPVDNLSPGAPVTFLGVATGEVTRVGLAYAPETRRMRARVEITFSPQRVIARLPAQQVGPVQRLESDPRRKQAFLRAMIEEGLRAQLRTSSLVTGQRYVAFDYFPRAPRATLVSGRDPQELPVVPSLVPGLEEKLAALLDNLGKVPFDAVASDLRDTLRTARTALGSMDVLFKDVDKAALPRLMETLQDARTALNAAERMMNGASETLVGRDAPAQRELRAALQEVARAARSLRALSDSIELHPESLLRGRNLQGSTQ